jgi:hypothetical protein
VIRQKFKTNVEGVFVSEMLQTTYTVKRLLLERVVWLLLMLKDIWLQRIIIQQENLNKE